MAVTTIQLSKDTREDLARLKGASRHTYDDIIKMLLGMVPEGDDEGTYTNEFRLGLVRSELDLRAGRVSSNEDVKRRLGLH